MINKTPSRTTIIPAIINFDFDFLFAMLIRSQISVDKSDPQKFDNKRQ